jgi:hypothetical protein
MEHSVFSQIFLPLAVCLTRFVRFLGLNEGLAHSKTLWIPPLSLCLTLEPSGECHISWMDTAPLVTDAVIHWESEKAAKWTRLSFAGRAAFAPREMVSVEGDIAWIMGMYHRLSALPFAQADFLQRWVEKSPLPFPVWLQSKVLLLPEKVFSTLAISQLHAWTYKLQAARDTFIENRSGISHRATVGFSEELAKLVEAIERLELRVNCLDHPSS